MNLFAEIKDIKYSPQLCEELTVFNAAQLTGALNKSSFLFTLNEAKTAAVSVWVSAKRTRSYPFTRVYDTLNYSGKKITIIPIFKDEGFDGDRDFIQWDTISWMSLLDVFVIVAYYDDAEKNPKYENKITNQKYNEDFIFRNIMDCFAYKSNAFHWNIMQIDKIFETGLSAKAAYERLSRELSIKFHSFSAAQDRLDSVYNEKEKFMARSRSASLGAQAREVCTIQPKERVSGTKKGIDVANFQGGLYHLTVDEFELHDDNAYIIESKHSEKSIIPKFADIKDGLFKMILYCNLEHIECDGKKYKPIPILKLTSNSEFQKEKLNSNDREKFSLLKKEAEENGFQLFVNQVRHA